MKAQPKPDTLAGSSIRRAIRVPVADLIGPVRGPVSVEEAVATFLEMFRRAMSILCRHVVYSDDLEYRARARAALPKIAGDLLFQELQECGEVRPADLQLLRETLDMLNEHRGGEETDLAVQLLGVPLSFDRIAAAALCAWAANPPAEANATSLGLVELQLGGDVVHSNLLQDFAAFQRRAKEIGHPVSSKEFASKVGMSRRTFYRRLNSPRQRAEVQKIRTLMAIWPDTTLLQIGTL